MGHGCRVTDERLHTTERYSQPCEMDVIHDRAGRPRGQRSTSGVRVALLELAHFVRFDWATEQHDVVVADRTGPVVLPQTFDDTAAGWDQLRVKHQPFGQVGEVLDTSRGSAVERLLAAGWTVYPRSPQAAERSGWRPAM